MKNVILAFIFLMSKTICISQNVCRYKFDHFDPKTGLSGIYVRKILKDPFGFVWVGTEDGLNRFNGENFTVYNKELAFNHKISGSDIRDMLIDTVSNSIWSVNSYGGIDQINYQTGNVIFNYIQNKDVRTRNLLLSSLAIYKSNLYIGSTDGLFVLNCESKKIERFFNINPFSNDSSSLTINKVLIDNLNRLWIFCEGQGICLVDLSKKNKIAIIKTKYRNPNSIHYYDACFLKSGDVFCGTDKGLIRYYTSLNGVICEDYNPLKENKKLINPDVYSCCKDSQGNLWFSQLNFLKKIDGVTKKIFEVKENISGIEQDWLSSIFCIYLDNIDNLWLGSQQGLMHAVTQPSAFMQFSKSANSQIKISHAYYIKPVNDSLIYSCAQDGLYKINIKNGNIFSIQKGSPFYCFFIDPYKKKITSSINGLFVLDDKGKTIPIGNVYSEFLKFDKIVINSVCEVGDSLIIFGTENNKGVFIWKYKQRHLINIHKFSKEHPLKENTVNGLFVDKFNRLWVLGDNSISLVNLNSLSVSWPTFENPSDKSLFSIFFDVCQVKNKFYIATYGSGLLVYDTSLKFISKISLKNGLTTNNIYKILSWNDSLLFVSSNNGITQIDLGDILKTKQYFDIDGLHGNIFEENSGTSLNNSLLFGGKGGITMIDPMMLKDDKTDAHLYIDNVQMKTKIGLIDTSNLKIKRLDIPIEVLQTTINFSLTDFSHNKKNIFYYRIHELEDVWISLNNQRFVNLVGLSPGEYTVEIRTSNNLNESNYINTSIILNILPKWYQTLWFKVTVLMLFVFWLFLMYNYRLVQIKKQVNIRKEIAGDLHDEIGSTLTAVKVYAHLAQKEKDKNDYLDRIENSINAVSLSLRDIIWVLDQSDDNLTQLFERIIKFALPLLHAKNILFEYHLDNGGQVIKISKTEKRNLLLIAKESINNSVKYSKCVKISLNITYNKKIIILNIIDDGIGFNLSNKLTESGYGLKNIKHRAKQINYSAVIISEIGKGTNIYIKQNNRR